MKSAPCLPQARCALWLALALTLASGVAGLAHEILWTRRLVDLLGASADTFAKVIGAFFLGLALGAWLASRPAGWRANFWLRLAAAEFAVAALALPALFCMNFADAVGMRVSGHPLLKLLLSAGLVAPPAAAMGMALPFLMRALAQCGALDGRGAVWLYAMNTLGGVLGIGATLLWALPRFGLTGAGLVAVGINSIIAVVALFAARLALAAPAAPILSRAENDLQAGRQCTEQGRKWERAEGDSPLLLFPLSPFRLRLVAFCSGFLVLALEVILQHQLAQVTINSLFSSGLVLAIVLVSLTIAAAFVSRIVHWLGDADRALTVALAATGVLCALQPFLLTAMRDGVNILPYELPPAEYVWEVLQLGAVTLCPALVGAGLVFPLLLRGVVNDEAPASVPAAGKARRAGVLLAWNGLGGWMGAEVCQSWLAPSFGLWTTVIMIAGGYVALLLCAVAAGALSRWRRRQEERESGIELRVLWRRLAVGCLPLLVLAPAAWFSRSLPQTTIHSGERLAAIEVGREGVVAVVECGPVAGTADWRMLFNNSYTLGGSRAQFNQERQAHLPLLLHGNARTVACLGVATGGTVAGAALHEGVERIDAVELSPLVLRFAEQWFTPYNRDVFRDSRVRFIQEDARSVIAGKHETYDVVVGDLFLPWRTGEGRLFALEHFQNVKRSLKPGGMFCQWLPMFQLTRPQFEAIARTFHEVFPDAFLLRGDFYTELPILGLVGGRSLSALDWPQVEEACARLREAGQVTDPLTRHAEGVAMMTIAPLPVPVPGPINTMGNGWLEWDAGRNILGLREPWFVGVPQAEFVRDLQRAGQSLLPPPLRNAQDAGQFFLTLEVTAKLELPVLENLKSQIPERMPRSLREDAGADWRQWPMRVKPDFTQRPDKNGIRAPR